MKTSESIKEISAALLDAQTASNRHAEASLLPQLARMFGVRFHGNQNDGKTLVHRFFEKIVTGASDCWLWYGAQHKLGYGLMSALGESKAHRVSWRLHNGDIPTGMSVLHKCDVRHCVNPEHLFLGTQAHNVADMVAKGRSRGGGHQGAAHPMAKLDEDKIQLMRELRKQKLSFRAIGERFGVAPMTAYRAITGTSWSKA